MSRGPDDQVEPLRVELGVVAEHPSASRIDETRLANVARFALEAEQQRGPWLLTVALVDDEVLLQLHEQFMGVPTVTDVMTFPLDGGTEDRAVEGGDIAISVDRAMAQGPDHGLDWEREVVFLFVHGLLHLCAWSDATEPAREAMLQRQRDLIEAFDARASGYSTDVA